MHELWRALVWQRRMMFYLVDIIERIVPVPVEIGAAGAMG
jgi:hypothetical protein